MAVLVHSALCDAMESAIVQVESGYMRGFAGLQLLGQASEVCRNGVERARAALEQLGVHLPQKKVVISLAPADLKKDGSQFDLAFAVSLACLVRQESGSVDGFGAGEADDSLPALGRWLYIAELGLGGQLRPVKNIISFVLAAVGARLTGVVIARENLKEVAALASLPGDLLGALEIVAFEDLAAVLSWLAAGAPAGLGVGPKVSHACSQLPAFEPNFDDMVVKPALAQVAQVVAAGMHSLLLYGTPGCGKSMFASRLTSLLPAMDPGQHLEALKIHSALSEHLPAHLLAGQPPFRSPHHQTSAAALMGIPEQPGEVSLAHGGVLFLDEFPEFRRDLLEALREPLENGHVRVSRAKRKVAWACQMTLVAACNLCPCGWHGSKRRLCSCPTQKILAYRRKLSGPILDRIDLHVNVEEFRGEAISLFRTLAKQQAGPSRSAELQARVKAARAFAAQRNLAFGIRFNRELAPIQLEAAMGLSRRAFRDLLADAVPAWATSRSLIKVLRVARTLADLEERPAVGVEDLRTALSWQADGAAKLRGESLSYGEPPSA